MDWNAGRYEQFARELEPAAEVVVARADPAPGAIAVDLACGDGNAAVALARRGARVIGVDGASRLLDSARARDTGSDIDFRHGDLLALPVDDGVAAVAVSSFGLIFAPDPERALAEAARILAPGGRLVFSAWVPAGPIDAMLARTGALVREATGSPAPERFAWSDPETLQPVAAAAGLTLAATTPQRLAIRAASPQAYVAANEETHPMALAQRGVLERAEITAQVRAAQIEVLAAANEDPSGFLVHSPYVIHELRRSSSS